MNEQDIIKRIEKETENLPIPDSISPSSMEKMLNEHIEKEAGDTSDKITNKQDLRKYENDEGASKNPSTGFTSRRNRFAIAFAACLGVIIIGSGAATVIKHNSNTGDNETALTEAAMDYEYEESADEDADFAIEESAPDESVSGAATTTDSDYDSDAEDEEIGKELALAGDLHKAKSYDDYYDAIKEGYDKYMETYRSAYATGYDWDDDMIMNDESADTTEAAMEEAEAGEMVAESDSSDYSVSSNSDYSRDIGASTKQLNENSNNEETGKDYSSTNTQEKTVDEGDIVKTDGEYIYVAHNQYYDSQPFITVAKAGKEGALSNTDTIELPSFDGNPPTLHEMYLYRNYLIVLMSASTMDLYYNSEDVSSLRYYDSMYRTNSYISIYDVSNKNKIRLIKTLSQSGYYEGSRISDGCLYTISNFNRKDYIFDDPKTGRSKYQDYVPYLNDGKMSYKNLYYSDHLEKMSTYVISSIDLNKPEKFKDSKGVSSSEAQLYVGEDSIYLYSPVYDNITKTEILKIAYDKGELTVGNRAVVAGYLYDSFALSEYKGNLRIVSTIPANNFSWYVEDVFTRSGAASNILTLNEDINALYVLDDNMHLLGRITGLAPGEQIYSARFMGDIGYFVTYRNTDPLFSVDLSNPREPKILGALKIPGFSNYLHFYGKGTLLGIGEERNPYNSEFYGLKLSMFDISDPKDVTENDKYVMYDTYSSPAQYNHRSIMIDPEKNVFGFCYDAETLTNSKRDNRYYTYDYYYSTFTFDKKKGFIETARYKLDFEYTYDINAVRGIYIGDYFYLVTPESITSYKLGDTNVIDKITL